MHADVRGVPVFFMREENERGLLFVQDSTNNGYGRTPLIRKFLFPAWRNVFKSVIPRLDQFESEKAAGLGQLLPAFGLALAIAALRDGDVDDLEVFFAQQSERQAADDALVVGMRRKEEYPICVL